MKKIYLIFCSLGILLPLFCRAMPPGTLVYRTSSAGRMFGYSGDPLIYDEEGIVKNINSGHVGIYIGEENGVEYIVEALASGVVKTPADKFINLAEGEKYLGAKIPKKLSAVQQAKVVSIAKNLAGMQLKYDFDFDSQKGPESGDWTCVGLTEKIYESANISNPSNLGALEYDETYYGINITPDGFNNYNIVNEQGDCLSLDYEYSKIAARPELIIPAPEIVGYNMGIVKNDERYLFLPYTQYAQASLSDVTTDIVLESSFPGAEVRGNTPTISLILRWSLLNNPASSLTIIARKTKEALVGLKNNIFGEKINSLETELIVDASPKASSSKSDNKEGKNKVVVNTAKKTNTKQAQPKSKSSATKKETNSSQSKDDTQINTGNAPVNENENMVSVAAYYNPVSTNEESGIESPKIATINKIYATENNKWIELYNPTDQDFDLALAGYRLEKAKTAADPSLIMRIGNTEDGSYPGGTIISAKGTYLIVKSSANDYYLRQADAIATRDAFTWPGSGYTIYLGTGAISSINDEDIIEAVGFGSDALYYQGIGPAPEISENYSLNRYKSTQNNKGDFKLVKSSDPGIDWTSENEEASTTSATSTSNINTNISSSTQAATNNSNNASSSPISPTKLPLQINGLYGTGINDWIEIYNPNNFEVDLIVEEYRLEKTKTAIDPVLMMRIGDILDGAYPKGTIISPNSSYLIVRDDANEYFLSKASAIATRSDFNWTNSGHTIYLANGPISSSTDENLIDMIGFGEEASYWRGNSASLAMLDNYELKRIGASGNNNLDYELRKSDDPGINWDESVENTETSTGIYSFEESDYDLYVPPVPISSENLKYVWHFDECGGTTTKSNIDQVTLNTKNHWTAGKFDCAVVGGSQSGNLIGKFDQEIDINNFSLSFWFKQVTDNPRLILHLVNSDGDYVSISLEQNLLEFEGLPNPDWRYYQPFQFDNIWRQATLVVNRENGYWTLYIDGEEEIRIESYKKLAPMDIIEVSGNNGPFAIDELSVWTRALSKSEIQAIRNEEAPFSPINIGAEQTQPKLVSFWNFDEGIGTSSQDLITGKIIKVDKNSWINLSPTNAAISVVGNAVLSGELGGLSTTDISMSFKWRSLDTSVGNRARISLVDDKNDEALGFAPTEHNSDYNLDGRLGVFEFGLSPSIPLDSAWHYLSIVYDSYRKELNYYVDGERRAQEKRIRSQPIIFPESVEISGENGMVEFDDLGIWDGALSERQIKSIFANN